MPRMMKSPMAMPTAPVATIIKSYGMSDFKSVVILTGAGISAESGIKTFRAADGLWENHRVEDVASPEGFSRDPELVHQFYNTRRNQLLHDGISPNKAHFALAELETHFSSNFLLITQNIDNLHEQSGSKKVCHMHGEILQMRCSRSGQVFPILQDLSVNEYCSCCNKPGYLRPNIVWFGEVPLFMDEIYTALDQCDLFVAIGTSGNVYPAAGFAQVAGKAGARTVEINLEPSAVQSAFNEARYGLASEKVPAFVNNLLAAEDNCN